MYVIFCVMKGKENDILISNTDLANTFQLIQQQGPDVFYQGTLAQEISQVLC